MACGPSASTSCCASGRRGGGRWSCWSCGPASGGLGTCERELGRIRRGSHGGDGGGERKRCARRTCGRDDVAAYRVRRREWRRAAPARTVRRGGERAVALFRRVSHRGRGDEAKDRGVGHGGQGARPFLRRVGNRGRDLDPRGRGAGHGGEDGRTFSPRISRRGGLSRARRKATIGPCQLGMRRGNLGPSRNRSDR